MELIVSEQVGVAGHSQLEEMLHYDVSGLVVLEQVVQGEVMGQLVTKLHPESG